MQHGRTSKEAKMITNTINNELFVGIDGGGTKCKAIIVNSANEILGTGIAGPGNPLHGFTQAINSIEQSAQLALNDAGLSETPLSYLVAGVGLAGVNLPSLHKQMMHWKSPFKTMYLTTDLLIACMGAHQGDDGAVIIAGTGSCGFSYVKGQSFMIGGHGFPHGDKGSGAWIGFTACQNVLLSLDKLMPNNMLTECVLKYLSVNDAMELVEIIANKPAAFFAQLAGCVFQSAAANDVIAISILKESGAYLSDIARRLLAKKSPRLSFIGGLSSVMTPWLDKDIQGVLSAPLSSPEMGSVLYAKQQQVNYSSQEL
jgi:glucosamine kinase